MALYLIKEMILQSGLRGNIIVSNPNRNIVLQKELLLFCKKSPVLAEKVRHYVCSAKFIPRCMSHSKCQTDVKLYLYDLKKKKTA